MERKPLPIGIDDFKEVINGDFYYIDKTMLIKELLDKKAKVNLFTRPRRFGKTLNMSMLQYFFEDTGSEKINSLNKVLFQDMKITKIGNKYVSRMNKYPVITLTLKSSKQPTWELAYSCLKESIENEFQRHINVIPSITIEADKIKYQDIVQRKGREQDYITALAFLSRQLAHHYGKPAIILIDEYDVPLENAYFCGFYDQMIGFIRSLFESALKTNENLDFAVITGCLRITKESIFTGLNNLNMISILNESYGEYFGFLSEEVQAMLDYYGCREAFPAMQEWYDGYLFGGKEVYNPWSVVNFADSLLANPDAHPRPFWSNVSSNNIVKRMIECADIRDRDDIEELMTGKSIEKPLKEDITYEDMTSSSDNLWNFLLFTGYLKIESQYWDGDICYGVLSFPNREIRYIYRRFILEWFDERMKKTDLSALGKALESGDCDAFGKELTDQLMESISYYDYKEDFYHGFLAGILKNLDDYRVLSNRESGTGRPDLLLKPRRPQYPAVVMELKSVKIFSKMEAACEEALTQIKKMDYPKALIQEGYEVISYGICFCQKVCMVKKL